MTAGRGIGPFARNTIHCCDALDGLKRLPDESIDVVVTSPPYWALRDYGVRGQLGAEQDIEDYLQRLLAIFDEVRRVLKPEGTCWVNLGDTYASPGVLNASVYGEGGTKQSVISAATRAKQGIGRTSKIQAKSLIGIPERFMLTMIERSRWVCRNKIVWRKPNHMPSSARDRFACSWEFLFLFVKSRHYYFDLDAVREPFKRGLSQAEQDFRRMMEGRRIYRGKARPTEIPRPFKAGHPLGRTPDDFIATGTEDDCWTIMTKPFKGAHFAVFPEALIQRPIKTSPSEICSECGTPRRRIVRVLKDNLRSNISPLRLAAKERDSKIAQPAVKYDVARQTLGWTKCGCKAPFRPAIVLDPFIGSGTTAVVAKKLGRDYLGFDLKPEYVELAQERLRAVATIQPSGGGALSRAA